MSEMVDRVLDVMLSRGLMADEADARAVIAAMSVWRPIDDNTPRHGNYARVSVEEGVLYCPNGGAATHWMPLPAAPP